MGAVGEPPLVDRGRMGDDELEGRQRERFTALYDAHIVSLLGYARRRTDQPASAADVVAETFVVAWRRLDAVPDGEEARLWLYGVAHGVLANHHRGQRRRRRLGERLAATAVRESVAGPAESVGTVGLVREALACLPVDDREVLRLTIWEQLNSSQVAVVLAIPAATVRTRLHRARGRLREVLRELGHDDEDDPEPDAAKGTGTGRARANTGVRRGHEAHDGQPLVSDHEGQP
jgi:RNA polymerase sigma factor (sigma-70 family)